MKKSFTLKSEDFEAFLSFLAENRDNAGAEYEKLRRGLIHYFQARGCTEPETLTDETINRVAVKVHLFNSVQPNGKLAFIYGFASKIRLESLKAVKKTVALEEFNPADRAVDQDNSDESSDEPYNCLKKCLKNLSETDRRLIIDYYSLEKSAKIELRKKISKDCELTISALHTKVCRIRNGLRKCIGKCLREQKL